MNNKNTPDLDALLQDILINAYTDEEQVWAVQQYFEDQLIFPEEVSSMNNKRKYDRFGLTEDVMFANQLTHPYCYYGASTINYSKSGICLTSRYEVAFGDSLCLRMIGKHLYSCSSIDNLTCIAEVKWCQAISLSREPVYHIGLHYSGQVPVLFKP